MPNTIMSEYNRGDIFSIGRTGDKLIQITNLHIKNDTAIGYIYREIRKDELKSRTWRLGFLDFQDRIRCYTLPAPGRFTSQSVIFAGQGRSAREDGQPHRLHQAEQ